MRSTCAGEASFFLDFLPTFSSRKKRVAQPAKWRKRNPIFYLKTPANQRKRIKQLRCFASSARQLIKQNKKGANQFAPFKI
jgi:hypothetical protein